MRLCVPPSLERQKGLFSGSVGTFASQLKQESTVMWLIKKSQKEK